MYARDTARIATPIGMVVVEGDDVTIDSIRIDESRTGACDGKAKAVRDAVAQLHEYFAGKRRDFDLPLRPPATPRGNALRHGMIDIPYGQTMTYGELARRIGSAPRAVGQACSRNPFPIVIPCHRVLSSSGPEHYSAGNGITTKRWLLDHERRVSGVTLL